MAAKSGDGDGESCEKKQALKKQRVGKEGKERFRERQQQRRRQQPGRSPSWSSDEGEKMAEHPGALFLSLGTQILQHVADQGDLPDPLETNARMLDVPNTVVRYYYLVLRAENREKMNAGQHAEMRTLAGTMAGHFECVLEFCFKRGSDLWKPMRWTIWDRHLARFLWVFVWRN